MKPRPENLLPEESFLCLKSQGVSRRFNGRGTGYVPALHAEIDLMRVSRHLFVLDLLGRLAGSALSGRRCVLNRFLLLGLMRTH
jgi:hypothetical protein